MVYTWVKDCFTNNLETATEVTTMVSHLVMNWLFDLEEVCC
jgi:hypothetical protein